MNTELQKQLAEIAPSILIETIWINDPSGDDFEMLREQGNCFENENRDDWEQWQSEVRATIISKGSRITGSSYLGGNWERYGDIPAKTNPTISGYENQMTIEALEAIPEAAEPITAEICKAIDFIKCQI